MNHPLPVFVRESTVESTAEILTLVQFTAERLGTRDKRDTSFLCTLMHIEYQEAILIQHMFEGHRNSQTFSAVWLDYTALDGLLEFKHLLSDLPAKKLNFHVRKKQNDPWNKQRKSNQVEEIPTGIRPGSAWYVLALSICVDENACWAERLVRFEPGS
jgi:hypothetical protein